MNCRFCFLSLVTLGTTSTTTTTSTRTTSRQSLRCKLYFFENLSDLKKQLQQRKVIARRRINYSDTHNFIFNKKDNLFLILITNNLFIYFFPTFYTCFFLFIVVYTYIDKYIIQNITYYKIHIYSDKYKNRYKFLT